MEACYAIECVLHGCDVLNKRGFARPYVLSEHTLVNILPCPAPFPEKASSLFKCRLPVL